MDDHEKFIVERAKRIMSYQAENELNVAAQEFLKQSLFYQYSYNFEWMGLPVIQYPQDLIALQEIIWRTQPDLIIETGIARGGSLVFYASMLAQLGGNRKVIGIDVDLRLHNKERLLKHPMAAWIQLVEGSSIEANTVIQVKSVAEQYQSIMVCLDANHTHEHVLQELHLYAPLVTQENYCVVFDTIIEMMPKGFYQNRPWDKANNPKTAISSYLKENADMKIDDEIDRKLLISAARGGYLKNMRK
jgi:cephalosporin hydroxylase